jgi:hypothetical protein
MSRESIQNAPTPPAALKLTCTTGPTSDPATNCPVITYSGIKFWPFSYIDNRGAVGLVGYKGGQVVSQQELVGTRYVWDATVNTTDKTVIFYGQINQTASVAWANLK